MLVRNLSDIILTILVLLFLWCFTTIYTDVVVLLCFLSLVKFFLTYYLCHLSNSQLKHTTYQKYFMCYDKLQKLKLGTKTSETTERAFNNEQSNTLAKFGTEYKGERQKRYFTK